MAKNYDDIGGVWRTVGGRHIFIKDGQDLASAMKESGKFKKQKTTTDSEEQKRFELNQKLKEAQEKVDKLDEELAEYEEDEMMAGSPAHDELRWKYEDAKEEYYKIKNELRQMQKTSNENAEYNLYKQARENEGSISPMAEWSTDWEALDEKYRDRYEKEQKGIKEISYIGQDNKMHKMNSYDYPKERDNYHNYLNEKYGTYKEEEIVKKDNSLSYAKLRNDFYERKAYQKYLKEHPNSKMTFEDFKDIRK